MANKFTNRSYQSELMDNPDIPRDLLYRNLRELDFLNRYTFGHQLSISAIEKLITANNGPIHIVDLGCGSGDTLKQMARWARKKQIHARFTGIDSNPDTIAYLREHCREYPEVKGIDTTYQEYLSTSEEVDIYHCSLFTHHLENQELIELFSHFNKYPRIGFVISDILRSPFAYYGSKILTRLGNGTSLARHDGPVSVLKGFRIREIRDLLAKAEISDYELRTAMGFRFILSGRSNGKKTSDD
ncbi:MAG: methyltransferase domain-containing protein [Bacteroidetes bacterium]|nr:methyltransferase domain-containing protein [Bacteroidota bacterium]